MAAKNPIRNLLQLCREYNRFLLVLLISVGFSTSSCAFDWPLSTELIRDAYFFGRNSDRGKVAKFLGDYVRVFQSGSGNLFPARIEIRTPFQRIVQRSSENQVDYSAQQAAIDYQAEDSAVEVRVYLVYDNSFPDDSELYADDKGRIRDRKEEFWRNYKIRVTQESLVEPREVEGTPRYDCCGGGLSGARVRLKFDSSRLASAKTLVEVTAPDGRSIVADFPLDRLR